MTKPRYIPNNYIKFDPKYIIGAYSNLFECYVDKEKPVAMFFVGKRSTPTWHYRFPDNETMKKRVLESISKLMSHEDWK